MPVQPGLDLHCGVYNRIAKDFASGQLLALDITTHSEAPPGSGLGSSSTMVVTILKGFMELLALRLDDYEIANLAFDIERVDLKMAGGKQDQYAAAFGGLNYIEFYKDRVIVNPLRLKTNYKCEFESSLVLYFTGVSRQSAEIIEQQVSNVLTKSPGSLEAMHELKADALLMKEALLKGDFKLVSESMKRSWIAKKQTASSVSNSAIDEIFNAAMNSGALAGKVSGAGGGGFMMFLVDPVKRANVIATLNQFSGQVMTCGFVEYGAHAWRV